jgi:hypothetical protein
MLDGAPRETAATVRRILKLLDGAERWVKRDIASRPRHLRVVKTTKRKGS